MFQQFIGRSKTLCPRDVGDWTRLADQFRSNIANASKLNKKIHLELEGIPLGTEPNAALKQGLLEALNGFLANGTDRKGLEQLFPGAIVKARAIGVGIVDQLTWVIIIATVVGARLGHVFFYDWHYYAAHPEMIFMIRQGGLASHGGTIAVICALFLFLRLNKKLMPGLTFLPLLDILAVPTALVAFCIRLGNFFNQEILGSESPLPWAIIFGDPSDGALPVPRHPVQLYEAGIYLAAFGLLHTLWRKHGATLKPGTLIGLFFVLVFGSRFFIEFLKLPQSMMLDESFIQTGQLLSIPFVVAGIVLLVKASHKS
jgi:phosphatidylglycerol:prolipoprotein diacylglycerol transferase